MPENLQQGESRLIEFPILDSSSNPIDLTTATDIVGSISIGGVEQMKYSLNPLPGHGDLSIKMGSVHIALFHVKREQTVNFPSGILKVNLVVSLPDTLLDELVTEYNLDWGVCSTGNLKNETI